MLQRLDADLESVVEFFKYQVLFRENKSARSALIKDA